MKDWIEIFKTGTHTDSNGNTRTWTEQDLDNIVEKYNPDVHEAPIVIGHPKTNAPAYGWVAGLKRVGQYLYYKPKQVVEEFREMVNKGLFKKRSLSLYADNTLKHIGYLGATPPAIKGLPDHTFSEDDAITIEFEEYRVPMIGRILQKIREFIIEKYGAEAADKVVSDYEIDELKRVIPDESEKPLVAYSEKGKEEKIMKFFEWLKKKAADDGVTLDDIPTSFSEQDMKQKVDEAVKAKEDELTKSFSEKEKELKDREDNLKKQEAAGRKKSISDFCEGLKKKGILTPAMEKHGMGLQSFMEQISAIETAIEFSEGDEKKKQTPLEFMQSFLAALPKSIEFGEVAGFEKDTAPRGGNAGEKLDALVQKKMKDKPNLNYTQAFSEVQLENHELAKEYAEELRG